MLESKLLYKLDYIDLNILNEIIKEGYFIALINLVKRLEKRNVWDRGIIRRRLEKMKEMKLIWFIEKTSPIIIEVYHHQDEKLKELRDKLMNRLMKY